MSLKESKKERKSTLLVTAEQLPKLTDTAKASSLFSIKQTLKASLKISEVWSYRKLDKDHIPDLTWNGNLTAPKKCDMGCMMRRWAMAAKLRFEKEIKEIHPNKQM